MGLGDKIINYASMVFGGVLGTVLGLVIYRRTMARAEELMREDGAAEDGEAGAFINGGSSGQHGSGGGRMGGFSGPGVDYADLDDTAELRDPDELDAALMDADDISLWAAEGVADQVYRDNEDDGRRSNSTSSSSRSSRASPAQVKNPRRSPKAGGRPDEEADSTIRAAR
ncbi:hypothetical protein Micbo1qcDRAFT_157579 [Microdochium bolleyi]|uniref:Uncharacterized protein n=1 Tax=Microdochium bolleyi TaxID=196109 RepID=A0A136JEK4_9PEZI|nr:hypothetical protein Micbo1qcDRAFT_157579 [Microdochium bolleyi]